MRRSNQGFTLIEIMIVIAIIGLVLTLSLPSITEYVKKPHRSEIAVLLTEQAQQLERHFSKAGVYSNAPDLSAGNEYYSIAATLTDTGFSLTATPKDDGLMAADKCGSFSIDQTGATRISGQAEGLTAKDCWGR
ncbi:type IV pilus assembly protein PilE [Pseudomonas protegens]|jgi:type IV pilus assembly protein PilE|uniref:Type IV pilus biogenesis protein n=2 Tax=Pseudomonas TaxID=286 RepID=A0A2C9ETN1_PSEPH|nr:MULTISPECIES: type IV pilin protein [Pseudomonas]GED78747.1 pilus biosynthesis protein [Pseudomonas fluorescens]AGL87023.1 type IV pilus biogenesis protein [Pseudomonas protegens CHA0]APC22367.1 pilus assembly protein [Pseudomonas protegens]AQT12125.1 type IV pilus biogenesis protein [Pseudomonas protegens]MBB1614935.1 pilus assembly protein [Pseudomonas sp. UMC65]